MTASEKTIILIFGIWLLATIMHTVFNRKLTPFIRLLDPFHWLTSYQLFSQTERNFLLYYRERCPEQPPTQWKLVALTEDWKWHQTFWFPNALILNTINSLVDDLVRYVEVNKNLPVITVLPQRFMYRVILHYVCRLPGREERQFKIMETKYGQEMHEIFRSNFHKV